MYQNNIRRTGSYLLLTVFASQVCLLFWELLNGGVLTHHILARSDLPGISNWWGLLILPLLVLTLTSNVEKRCAQINDSNQFSKFYRGVRVRFSMMCAINLTASLIFMLGYQNIAVYLLFGVVCLGLFMPLYRFEAIVGYVLGGALFFGPMIPFIGVFVFASTSAISHLLFKPLLLRLINVKKSV